MNANPPTSFHDALAFLTAVYPDLPGLLCIFELPSRQARYFSDREAAAHWAVSRSGEQNVYFAVSLFREQPERGRGTEALSAGIPGVWADIDVRGAAHKADNLPPSIEAAKEMLAAIQVQPTLLVHSGHGLQAYWLFREFWTFESEDDAARAKSLCVRWQAMLRGVAQARGWTIDPTADLARVLRVPGTLNRKIQTAIRRVRFRPAGERYNQSDLEELVFDIPDDIEPAAGKPAREDDGEPANFPAVLDNCSWARHCRDDATSLPEPEWYQALTIVARCREAEKHAHEISRAYAKYSAAETDSKLQHAREKSPGPVTCRYVEINFGAARHCTGCAHQGRIKSPIQLGRIRQQAPFPDDPPPERDEPAIPALLALDAQIEDTIQKRDLALIYQLAPRFALLKPLEYQILRSRLQREFGRSLALRDLDLTVRHERLMQRASVVSSPGNWKARLHFKDGTPRAILLNALLALREAPEWKGTLAFDEFGRKAAARRKTPWGATVREWTDNEDRLTAEWLHSQSIYVSPDVAGQAVETVALEHPFHPVREYLDGLRWDGQARLGRWLETYVGAEPGQYIRTIGEKWMISAVARIFRPGCKADCCLILEGPQGIRKSTTLAILGGDWYTDEIEDLGTKDSAMQVQGAWIIEISELEGIARNEIGAIKAFISRGVDRFRPPYGKRLIESPRSCVFGGTANHNLWNRDETGARRFWPVSCTGEIRTDELARDRDQLWAEAIHEYRAGTPWWLASLVLITEAGEEQRARYQGDPWDDAILRWVKIRENVTVTQVLEECIEKPRHQCVQADSNRVARTLRSAGWIRCRAAEPDEDGKRPWRYHNPAYFE